MPEARGAEPARVAILFPAGAAYKQPADQILQRLSQRGHTCKAVQFSAPGAESVSAGAPRAADAAADEEKAVLTIDTNQTLEQLRDFRPALIVAVGHNAALLAMQAGDAVPVVACAVPNALDRLSRVLDSAVEARLAVIPMEVSPEAQMEWIHRSSPNTKRLGLLHSDKIKNTVEALVKSAQKRGITVCGIRADKESFRDALQALDTQDCDGALMIADAVVYNAASAQAILLWGLRGRKPVWTFSASLVKSGGFAAIFADPEDVPAQVADLVEKAIQGEQPGQLGMQYPRTMQHAVNERTAELIGIKLAAKVLEGAKRL